MNINLVTRKGPPDLDKSNQKSFLFHLKYLHERVAGPRGFRVGPQGPSGRDPCPTTCTDERKPC